MARKTPANWKFRDGRPRWEPGPGLRRSGWKGQDLKDPRTGAFLSEGASIDAARAINEAVAAWRAGERIPGGFAAIAPPGACEEGGLGARPSAGKLAIGRLVDAYLASDEVKALADKTRADYRNKLKRLVDVLAGWVALPGRYDLSGRAEHARHVEAIRAASVFILEPVETEQGISDPLHTAYWRMHREIGAHMATGVMNVAVAWLTWCRKRQSRTISNWAKDVERETPAGRIRVASWAELRALVETADEMGWLSVGDSIILGVDLSWSQTDRLSLTWNRCRRGICSTGPEGRKKTGNVGATPLLGFGRRRVAQIILRQRAMPAQPTHVLWCETTQRPWKADHYRHVFAAIRDKAAARLASVEDLTDQDLRDTAVTVGRTAGLNIDQMVSRTLQSRTRVVALWDAAYGAITPEIAKQGADLLNAYLGKKGVGL